MTSQYPAKIDDTLTIPTIINNSTRVQAEEVNDIKSAVIAIESVLGTSPASVYGTVRQRLENIESSIEPEVNSSNGGVTVNIDTDGYYTVPENAYIRNWIEFVSVTLTDDCEILFPKPTAQSLGYYKTIFNNTLYSLTISVASGTVRVVSAGKARKLWFDNSGVRFANSAEFSP